MSQTDQALLGDEVWLRAQKTTQEINRSETCATFRQRQLPRTRYVGLIAASYPVVVGFNRALMRSIPKIDNVRDAWLVKGMADQLKEEQIHNDMWRAMLEVFGVEHMAMWDHLREYLQPFGKQRLDETTRNVIAAINQDPDNLSPGCFPDARFPDPVLALFHHMYSIADSDLGFWAHFSSQSAIEATIYWPRLVKVSGWKSWIFGPTRARTKDELVSAMNEELERKLPGITWNFSQNIRDNVLEALSGIKGDNSVKIVGPDLDMLEVLATKTRSILQQVRGIENVGIFNIRGQSHMEWRVDPDKCERWGIQTSDVNNVVSSALGGVSLSNMVEGERRFDISVRWPKRLRISEEAILDIPVDIINNTVTQSVPSRAVPQPLGTALAASSVVGSQADTSNPISKTPRLRLRDLVSPVGEDGSPNTNARFERPGASTIYREQGKRLIAIKFSVRGRDLASAVAEAQSATKGLFQAPYRVVWSGEFEEMEAAEHRLLLVVPISLAMIFVLLYIAFRNFLDAIMVSTNVVALSLGGLWALLLTDTNFNISAAVGFISIFGVAIMDGLLTIAYFNQMRLQGMALRESILRGAEKRVRPMMMTALTAIFGLLPAALSTKIGSQTQRPLAIVVVGGMISALFLNRYLMPVLYSFYGGREPPPSASQMAH